MIIRAKLLIQTLWQKGYDWDDEISNELKETWHEIEADLNQIDSIKLKRFIGNGDCSLLCFCDASEKAFATCIYIRCRKDGGITTNLVFSKARVSPKEGMTIPKLELLGVVIGVRAMKYVKKHWKLKIVDEVLWTDSQRVVDWIRSTKRLGVFLQNRVDEVRKKENIRIRYVRSDNNPADLATRGKSIEEIRCNPLWWHAPVWVNGDE